MIVYICDNSEIDRIRIRKQLNRYADEKSFRVVFREFMSGGDLLAAARSEKPDAVFLDIFLRDMNGISLAEQLRNEHSMSGIVFCTTSSKHALDAFKVGADGYLLKPFSYNDLSNTMSRIALKHADERVFVSFMSSGKPVSLFLSSIFYAETYNHHTHFHTEKGIFSTTRPLSSFTETFSQSENFIACGKSYIVNLCHVDTFQNGVIRMENSILVPIPVRLKKSVLDTIWEYIRERAV